MAFEVPMKKSATLDRNSLSDKCGFMNVRKSFDKNTLNNDAFKKTVQKNQHQPTVKTSSRQPVISVSSPSPAPIKPVKKQRNIPAGNVFLRKGQKFPISDKCNFHILIKLYFTLSLNLSYLMIYFNCKVKHLEIKILTLEEKLS